MVKSKHSARKNKRSFRRAVSGGEQKVSSRDFVEAKDRELNRKGLGRRSILRFLVGGVGLGLVWIARLEGTLQFLKRFDWDADADQRLLERLFGVGPGQTGALVPAGNHPFKRPPQGADWYPIEGNCCAAYRQRFLEALRLKTVRGYPQIRPEDSLILFGSQVSNVVTRDILGDPWHLEPRLNINSGGWRTRLRWNLHSPCDAATIERKQFGGRWVTKDHLIVGSEGDIHHSMIRNGELEDDYLLVTSLPRSDRGLQRMVIFGAGHGPGQKAASDILLKPSIRDLEKLEKQTGRQPFYQALFHVRLKKDDEGEFCPADIQLVDAVDLEILYG